MCVGEGGSGNVQLEMDSYPEITVIFVQMAYKQALVFCPLTPRRLSLKGGLFAD